MKARLSVSFIGMFGVKNATVLKHDLWHLGQIVRGVNGHISLGSTSRVVLHCRLSFFDHLVCDCEGFSSHALSILLYINPKVLGISLDE